MIEDDPYGALDYAGAPLPTLLSMAPDHIVHLGSFSKVLAPGLRVGYIIAPEELHFKLVQAKQATDLHTPSLTQRIVHEVVKDGFLDKHVPTIRALYRDQCEAMLAALEHHMPAGVEWNRPEGGMFVWVKLPKHIDSMKLLEAADRATRRLRAGRAVLRERSRAQHAAPLVRDGAAREDRRRRRETRRADPRAPVSGAL